MSASTRGLHHASLNPNVLLTPPPKTAGNRRLALSQINPNTPNTPKTSAPAKQHHVNIGRKSCKPRKLLTKTAAVSTDKPSAEAAFRERAAIARGYASGEISRHDARFRKYEKRRSAAQRLSVTNANENISELSTDETILNPTTSQNILPTMCQIQGGNVTENR